MQALAWKPSVFRRKGWVWRRKDHSGCPAWHPDAPPGFNAPVGALGPKAPKLVARRGCAATSLREFLARRAKNQLRICLLFAFVCFSLLLVCYLFAFGAFSSFFCFSAFWCFFSFFSAFLFFLLFCFAFWGVQGLTLWKAFRREAQNTKKH